ncbi:trafficking protein particle complex subunit 5 [Psammomys obesus]|uniref:trafficking protein particle complex subunit 5 n=1 Tax=Psammomys obesus TaxID=48139 RepID=UPI0024536803|nr:trafficking protein particle complex subunit 5 [Psammomys obesus]
MTEARFTRGQSALLERSLGRPRGEVSVSAFGLLFSELVQHCQSRAASVGELQGGLAALGRSVGGRALEGLAWREKGGSGGGGGRRETRLLGALLFVKGPVWRGLFGREAERLEQANDDPRVYYLIEREPLLNAYVSPPRDHASLNPASFAAGVVEAVLGRAGFPARVSAHWHKGTTLMIKFDQAVLARERALEGR